MRISRSIFIKLIVIIILYGILINIAVALFFKFSTEFKPRRFVHTKLDEYIIKDIGFPCDTVKARSLMNELHMSIRIKSDNLDWTSSEDVPTFDEISKSEDYKEMVPNEESLPIHYKIKFTEFIRNLKEYSLSQVFLLRRIRLIRRKRCSDYCLY